MDFKIFEGIVKYQKQTGYALLKLDLLSWRAWTLVY